MYVYIYFEHLNFDHLDNSYDQDEIEAILEGELVMDFAKSVLNFISLILNETFTTLILSPNFLLCEALHCLPLVLVFIVIIIIIIFKCIYFIAFVLRIVLLSQLGYANMKCNSSRSKGRVFV